MTQLPMCRVITANAGVAHGGLLSTCLLKCPDQIDGRDEFCGGGVSHPSGLATSATAKDTTGVAHKMWTSSKGQVFAWAARKSDMQNEINSVIPNNNAVIEAANPTPKPEGERKIKITEPDGCVPGALSRKPRFHFIPEFTLQNLDNYLNKSKGISPWHLRG